MRVEIVGGNVELARNIFWKLANDIKVVVRFDQSTWGCSGGSYISSINIKTVFGSHLQPMYVMKNPLWRISCEGLNIDIHLPIWFRADLISYCCQKGTIALFESGTIWIRYVKIVRGVLNMSDEV